MQAAQNGVQPGCTPRPGKFGQDPRLLLVLRSFHPCKNVHMIVLDSLFGREMILDQRGADSLDRARAPASNASG
jgi:hypothetical protein